MKILFTSDFYNEYELYETADRDALIEYIKALCNGENVELDETTHTLLGTHDDISTSEARAEADEIIYIYDLIEE